jgi:hypothetical protein
VAQMDYEPLRVEDVMRIDPTQYQFECHCGAQDFAVGNNWTIHKLPSGMYELYVEKFGALFANVQDYALPEDMAIIWGRSRLELSGVTLDQYVLHKVEDAEDGSVKFRAHYSFIAELIPAHLDSIYLGPGDEVDQAA